MSTVLHPVVLKHGNVTYDDIVDKIIYDLTQNKNICNIYAKIYICLTGNIG